jgi:predicted phage baseplate assembly protein
LESGRWLIVSGEQSIAGTSGVRVSELVMLAGVEQPDPKLPSDTTHTLLTLAGDGLAYCYKRDSVVIYGNVVKATHGETRNETMGSGDGSKSMQSFPLRQPPLTFVSASNPSGAESTLQVRVNDVQWHETDSLADLLPRDRKFVTRIDDNDSTTVVFGTGQHGARLPSGQENLKAIYRSGIGKPGNVNAEQISLLATRPLGVKAVINPLRASGGADKEDRDQARRNAPLAVMALDRLVSVQDYADFARTFAGIGKASAAPLSDGSRQVVHITIAGADDIPIDGNSDLFRNLLRALHDFGDPHQAIQLAVRELMALVISAKVRIDPDYLWEKVVLKVRQALLEQFSFTNRELGQDAVLSEAISTMQKVEGVVYVDVDLFGGILTVDPETRQLRSPGDITEMVQKMGPNPRVSVDLAQSGPLGIRPAQLAFLTPEVADTVILTEVTL